MDEGIVELCGLANGSTAHIDAAISVLGKRFVAVQNECAFLFLETFKLCLIVAVTPGIRCMLVRPTGLRTGKALPWQSQTKTTLWNGAEPMDSHFAQQRHLGGILPGKAK